MSNDPIIPGAKLIEQGLAALPSQARLEVENRELRLKLALSEKKIAELEAQIAILQPPTGIAADAGKILKLFFDSRAELSAKSAARQLGLNPSVVDHYFDELQRLDFIQQSRAGMTHDSCLYAITSKGRAFIVKQGMA